MANHARHFLAYIRAGLISEWKTLTLHTEEDRSYPYAYGFDDDSLFEVLSKNKERKSDDYLWFIGSTNVPVAGERPRKMPPALVGKLKISHVRKCRRQRSSAWPDDRFKYAVFADESKSCFYGPNDFLDILMETKVRHLSSRISRHLPISSPGLSSESRASAWRSEAAHLLQHSWEVLPDYAPAITRFARKIRSASVFISYKHNDSKALIAIVTNEYGRPTGKNENWTLKELQSINRRVCWMRDRARKKIDHIALKPSVTVGDVSTAARRIAKQLKQLGVEPLHDDDNRST